MKPILFNTQMVKAILDNRKTATRRLIKNDPYQIDDILYVRETFRYQIRHDGIFIVYKADNPDLMNYDTNSRGSYSTNKVKWRPSVHMPYELARIFLRVTNMHAERLQDIKFHQVYQEGIPSAPNCAICVHDNTCPDTALKNQCEQVKAFTRLWDSTIKKSDFGRYDWQSNPWVWVYEFERISKDEARRASE